ncbi:MAG: hypothetical protein IAE89_02855 [Anaerolineae bacterium]|nr:hypothetical protein [Anaerolineae bacterium]
MERIAAANNLIIEYEQDHWRLLQDSGTSGRILVETTPDAALRYPSSFGVIRRLPENGTLDAAEIERVVLGWSSKDQTWHLGLMLQSSLAEARGSRWCGLAVWPAPNGHGAGLRDAAAQAGEQLANQIQRPFLLVPPKVEPVSTNGITVPAPAPVHRSPVAQPAYQPAAPPVETLPPPALPELPYQLDDWRLDRAADGRLIFTLPGLMRRRVLKSLWYLLWAVVFAILSITSLMATIAPPQPTFLPYAGIVGAVFLLGLSIVTFLNARKRIVRIEVDGAAGTIRSFKVGGSAWQYQRDDISDIYASQVMGKINRRQHHRTAQYGELNLRLHSGEFVPVIFGIDLETKIEVEFSDDEELGRLNEAEIAPLTIYSAKTKLQAAALRLAETLNINAVNDRRIS